jgi:hypothetical protein
VCRLSTPPQNDSKPRSVIDLVCFLGGLPLGMPRTFRMKRVNSGGDIVLGVPSPQHLIEKHFHRDGAGVPALVSPGAADAKPGVREQQEKSESRRSPGRWVEARNGRYIGPTCSFLLFFFIPWGPRPPRRSWTRSYRIFLFSILHWE